MYGRCAAPVIPLDFSGPPRVQVPEDGEKGLLRATALRIDKERFSFVIEGLSKPWKLHYRWGLWVCLRLAVLVENPRTSAVGVADRVEFFAVCGVRWRGYELFILFLVEDLEF